MDTSQIFVDMARQAREFAEMCNRVANESNAVKEDPEAWRERNRQRQAAGVKFEWRNEGIWRRGYKGSIFTFDIGGEEDYREVQEAAEDAVEIRKWADRYYSLWCAIENNRAFALSPESLEIYRRYAEEVNIEFYGKQEVPQPIPHAAERALPKPTKLTARIARCGIHHGYIKTQDWEFYGTPEEYRAECGKYGYAVVSEIKEVDKPKTVKHYFCMFKDCNGRIDAFAASSAERLQDLVKRVGCTIIGNIEEREVPIMDVINLKGMVEKPKTVKRYMAMLKYKTDPPFSCVMDSCHTITLYATRKGYNIIGNIEEREVPIE